MRPRLPFLPATLVVASLLLVACTDDTPTADSPAVDISPDGSAPEPASLPDDEPALAPNATVERVVDGDTIVVELQGQRERVRLLGIDTPESVAEDRPDQCYGAEAGAYLTDLLPVGTDVALVRDVEPRDQYDRLLAYVVRTDDQDAQANFEFAGPKVLVALLTLDAEQASVRWTWSSRPPMPPDRWNLPYAQSDRPQLI